ncbi:four helix bundle protein [Candidatus Pacearchaeota archaeon]|nr:four helix bundle protein [Candidatus Pacearchaeota archaeon]
MQDFKKLQTWKLSFEFGKEVYKITKNFPREEMYSITSQLRRASLSISANIAEGTGRNSDKDFLRFLHIAMGSLKECENFLLMSRDLNYISNEQFEKLNQDIQSIGLKLSSLIKIINNSIKLRLENRKINSVEKRRNNALERTTNYQPQTTSRLSHG